jgi:cardiolipin synthase
VIYRREVALSLRRHRLRRLHRKIAVIDGRLAFVGGINIISDLDQPGRRPRLDYSVRIEGPLLRADPRHRHPRLAAGRLGLVPAAPRAGLRPLPPASEDGGIEAAFLIRDNLRHRRDIEDAYLTAIAEARREIILANAYFLPGRRFRQALLEAARRGVRITLLTQGWPTTPQQYATRPLRPVSRPGVRSSNTTAAICTPRWRSSTNTGPPSARPTSTRSACCWPGRPTSSSATRALRPTSNGVSSGPSPPAPARSPRRLATRPRLQRILNWGAYGLVRLMIGIAGYGNRHQRGKWKGMGNGKIPAPSLTISPPCTPLPTSKPRSPEALRQRIAALPRPLVFPTAVSTSCTGATSLTSARPARSAPQWWSPSTATPRAPPGQGR